MGGVAWCVWWMTLSSWLAVCRRQVCDAVAGPSPTKGWAVEAPDPVTLQSAVLLRADKEAHDSDNESGN